jgi:hypothetical protein
LPSIFERNENFFVVVEGCDTFSPQAHPNSTTFILEYGFDKIATDAEWIVRIMPVMGKPAGFSIKSIQAPSICANQYVSVVVLKESAYIIE